MKNEYFMDPAEFFKTIMDPENEIHAVRQVNEDKMLVTYLKKNDFVEESENTNVVLAAFVTSYARLVLFEQLQKLGKRSLYMDTDSIIYYTDPNDPTCSYKIPEGEYLGDWKSEIKCGETISEFVAAGPKNYSYKTMDKNGQEKTVVKVRGFSLTHSASKVVNFEEMKSKVEALVSGSIVSPNKVIFPRILKDHDRRVFTKTVSKNYRPVIRKGKLSDFVVYPFGWVG